MNKSMAAPQAIWPVKEDTIFAINRRANERANEIGKENIINSTIGALLDDHGELIAFETVYSHLRDLPPAQIAAYAALAGEPTFLEAAIDACFCDYRPDGYIASVATPGGTGAVRHGIVNYTSPQDTVLTTDWYWAPYMTICEENQRKLDTFTFFNDQNTFNFEAYTQKALALLEQQDRLLTILNTPAHNPTGYTISDEEWDGLISFAKQCCENKDKKFIFLVDVAYIDFAGKGTEKRAFMKRFEHLPDNLLVLFAYSASKGFTMYGLRNGALIAVSSQKEIIDEFKNTCVHSNRGTWSNGTRGAMQVFADIMTDSSLREQFEKERHAFKTLLQKRGKAFWNAAKEANLTLAPYRDGFFVSVPTKDPVATCEALIKQDIFTVPLQKGIRFALCAVNEKDCARAPEIIKNNLV